MQRLGRFALIISCFALVLWSFQPVGNSAPQGLSLTITEPADRSYTNQTKVTVGGSVNTIGATVTANGTELPVADNNTFRGQISLPNEGPNSIEVRATVGTKSVVSVTRTVFRDTVAPTLSILQPAEGTTVSTPTIEVRGAVADTSAIAVTVNNLTAKIVGGKDALWFVTVPLTVGANQLQIEATDTAGNRTTLIRTVNRTGGPLTLTVDSPIQNSIVNASPLSVSGTATGTNVTVTANGTALSLLPDGSFSGQISVTEGINTVRMVATDAGGGRQEIVRTLTIDTIPPLLSGLTPISGSVIATPTTTIQGRFADATPVSFAIGSVQFPAQRCLQELASCGFSLPNVPVAEGFNYIRITATDAAGNFSIGEVQLTGKDRTPPTAPEIFPVASPTRLTFQNLVGRAEPGATITINGVSPPVTARASSTVGIFFANVSLNPGANSLQVTATDADGNISAPASVSITCNPNLPPPPVGQSFQINKSFGNNQRGLVQTELPRPLVTLVTDTAGNPVPGVAVEFRALQGGGKFVNNTTVTTAVTDAQGRAQVRYVAGSTPTVQLVSANFSGNTAAPTYFLALSFAANPAAGTTFSGVVLDQNLRALPNVLVRLGGQQTRTGSDGRFRLTQLASGPGQLLELIGRDQVVLPGRWPNLTFDVDLLPNVENRLGRPLFLPKVNEGINLPLDANNTVTQDTSYELPVVGGQPPIRVTAKAGTHLTFPPDISDRRFSVTRIPTDKVPMPLEDGRFTNLYVSVQPSGVIFDPPLEVSFPNLDNQPPNAQVLLMSFDHDAGRYVQVGTGKVNPDGKTITGEPGSGIRIGAWHGFPPVAPPPDGTASGDNPGCSPAPNAPRVGVPSGCLDCDVYGPRGPAPCFDDLCIGDAPGGMPAFLGTMCHQVPQLQFIRQKGEIAVPSNQPNNDDACLMVSKFKTDVNLPGGDRNFNESDQNILNDPDPDTYRVEVSGLPSNIQNPSVSISAPELDNPLVLSLLPNTDLTKWRTKKYIRLVSNDIDDSKHEKDLTIKVKLGDSVTAKITVQGMDYSIALPVGRPENEKGVNSIKNIICPFIITALNSGDFNKIDPVKTINNAKEVWAQTAVNFQEQLLNQSQQTPYVNNCLQVKGNALIVGTLAFRIFKEGPKNQKGDLVVDIPTFPIFPGSEVDVAFQISGRINTIYKSLGHTEDIAFVFLSYPAAVLPRALVVVKIRENGVMQSLMFDSIFPNTSSGSEILNIRNENPTKEIVKEDDEQVLAANYADKNFATIDIFCVKKIVRRPPDDGSLVANSWNSTQQNTDPRDPKGNETITGPISELRNTIFLPIESCSSNPRYILVAAHEIGHIITGLTHISSSDYKNAQASNGCSATEHEKQDKRDVNLMRVNTESIRDTDNPPYFEAKTLDAPRRLNCFQQSITKSRLPLK